MQMNKRTPGFAGVPIFHQIGETILSTMKIEQIFDKSIDSYGGLHFFHKFIDKSGLNRDFDLVLGNRPAQAELSYVDIFSSFAATCLAGGPYMDDMYVLKNNDISDT